MSQSLHLLVGLVVACVGPVVVGGVGPVVPIGAGVVVVVVQARVGTLQVLLSLTGDGD